MLRRLETSLVEKAGIQKMEKQEIQAQEGRK